MDAHPETAALFCLQNTFFFEKQKFDVKQLKIDKFIINAKQLKKSKFIFDTR